MRKSKLQWKIFAYFTSFSIILLTILWLFQSVFLTSMYKAVRRSEIKQAINTVQQNIDSPNLPNILRDLEVNQDIVIGYTNEFVIPDNFIVSGTHLETIKQDVILRFNNGQYLNLTFYAIISPVNATVSTLKLQLYLISAIMILFALIISIIISKRIAIPIEQLNKSAKSLGEGNYDTKFSGKGYLEIEELSNTLNQAASDLSKVDTMQRELIANVSHDLRTPLALIYSNAEIIHDFPEDSADESAQTIMDETVRLTTLVNDILDLSNNQTDMNLEIENYNLTLNIKNTIDRVSNLVSNDNFTINFEYDEEVFVDADQSKITQVFYNLLINAINYSTDRLEIIVRQKIIDNKVTIEVIDFGEGISEEDIPLVWNRYYKVDKNHVRPVTGSGLGLSIVKTILDKHKATYGVISEIDKGSTFYFELRI